MKTLLLLIYTVAAPCCFAQETTTNLVTAAPNFREVNGKLYNAYKSVLWKPINGKCADVKTNGIIVQTFRTNKTYNKVHFSGSVNENQSIGAYGGSDGTGKRLASSDILPDKRIFLLHYSQAAEGQNVVATAMELGVIKVDESTLELWDCGLPHVVAVVTTNQPTSKK